MAKSMKLEQLQQFLAETVEGKIVDSLSGLIAILRQVPGVNDAYVYVVDSVPLTREEEKMMGNLNILTSMFEGDPTTDSISLHVQYPWAKGFDYEIGFYLGNTFHPIANGLFGNIVKGLAS